MVNPFRYTRPELYQKPGSGIQKPEAILLRQGYGGQGSRKPETVSTQPPKPQRWPAWAEAFALMKADSDAGVGDTVERLIGDFASQQFKAWYLIIFKKTCGCEKRKADWNHRFNYGQLPIDNKITTLTKQQQSGKGNSAE